MVAESLYEELLKPRRKGARSREVKTDSFEEMQTLLMINYLLLTFAYDALGALRGQEFSFRLGMNHEKLSIY